MQSGSATQLNLLFPPPPRAFDNAAMSDDDSSAGYSRTRRHAGASRSVAARSRRGTFDRASSSADSNAAVQASIDLPDAPAVNKRRAEIDPSQRLRNKALRLLTTREHSREELLRKLAQAKSRFANQSSRDDGASEGKDELEGLVDALAAQGWQSDDRYAEAMVRRLAGQASKRFIGDKLAQAGIKKEVAQLALESLDQDDYDTARALWLRRFGETPRDDRERQRQIRFLLSRGFHLGDAFKIVPRAGKSPSFEE